MEQERPDSRGSSVWSEETVPFYGNGRAQSPISDVDELDNFEEWGDHIEVDPEELAELAIQIDVEIEEELSTPDEPDSTSDLTIPDLIILRNEDEDNFEGPADSTSWWWCYQFDDDDGPADSTAN